MKLLLDTNVLIWFLENNLNFKKKIKLKIKKEEYVYVSTISFLEIAIKQKIGKLELSNSIKSIFEITKKKNIQIINLEPDYIIEYYNVPIFADHKDPFDRTLIATAIFEGFTVVTSDQKFKNYTDIIKLIEA